MKKTGEGGMQFKVISLSDPYYRDELMLRWEAIEKPKGLPPGSERLREEREGFHFVAIEKKQLVGCIVCHPQSASEGKIFHLAFSEEYKGRPFSRQMLGALEEFLMDKGISHLYVEAGPEMKDFYAHLGFQVEEEPFEHYGSFFQKMGKTLLASA